MSKLKWFSGGAERSNQAKMIIFDLLKSLDGQSDKQSLVDLLKSYHKELQQSGISVPFILNRLNLEISKTIRKNSIILSKYQSEKFKELISLSNIRYF
ncbi:bacteriocin immunity protein [Enterococcus casseliflavus]|uniref:bacteriocin immunity protein n=1 Tax=Enterococcus casseliflavus TaxID=37734 RepID=UPI002DB7D873|nr:bacteriocin immunity protein [Enterococcus casseliflavus]MEB8419306.1 bacteriocin immunity protein [Enterococcus casseliflavus]